MMLNEQQTLKEKKLNFNLVEAITDFHTRQQRQELDILRLEKANQRLCFIVYAILSIIAISAVVALLFRQKIQHGRQMKKAGEKLASLIQKLNQTNAEKEIISQEFEEIMNDKENRQEIETLTPSILQKNGESRFRQRFELLYPLFLPRLREKVPTITRREELLSMLIVLRQDNKEIADLLAIAPRSVLMLRHRFRQKIGMDAEKSLENFIEEILEPKNSSSKANEE
jgi:DNA-binding CsgD family transcriptional regulator